jgi:hypothetical protein
MASVEDRLAELLDGSAPPCAAVDFDDVVAGVRRRRAFRLSGAVAAGMATAIVGALLVGDGWLGQSAPRPAARSMSQLAALTSRVPCDPAGPKATREQLTQFHAVTAVTCGEEVRQLPGRGQWAVDVRRVATRGVAQLQAAYDRPDEPRTQGPCLPMLINYPTVVLVDASAHALVPTSPNDPCGQPQAAVAQGFQGTTWQVVSTHPVRQIVSPQAQASGCPQAVKDMVRLAGARSSRGGPLFGTTPARVHLCVYQVNAGDPLDGTFQRGSVLSAADTKTLLGALTGPAPTGDCPDQSKFAAVTTDTNQMLTIELGGCWRVARSSTHWETGTANGSVVAGFVGSIP